MKAESTTATAVRVSVVVPTYNSARFIRQTLDAVFAQTEPADEVIVIDDGSSDDTIGILRTYGAALRVHEQRHLGVAQARNKLCEMATGDLIAFLDHDDVWHPQYLAFQKRQYARHPRACAYFTGHVDFVGLDSYTWKMPAVELAGLAAASELIPASRFLLDYQRHTGRFASMSYCCLPRQVLPRLGGTPFCAAVSGADDFHLFTLLPLVGPVVYAPVPLVAYRIVSTAQSHDQVKSCRLAVEAFALLHERYQACGDRRLSGLLEAAHASKCRHYAKVLLGIGQVAEARWQLRHSIALCRSVRSRGLSLLLLMMTALPAAMQPQWLTDSRKLSP